MNNRLLILTLLAALSGFWGCASGAEEECAFPSMLDVRLTVHPERMTASTRSTDENNIRDLNFYLYDTAGNTVLHRYQSAATLRFECPPGDYTLCAVANMHRDMGDLSPAELAACAVSYTSDYADLPMAGRLETTIHASQGKTVTLPPLELRRRVAKVAYHIAVAPADIELHSMRVCSVPKSVSLFDDDMPPAGGYADTPGTMLSGRGASGILYLPPNAQGTNPAITDPRLKNRDNAPENATYLLIRATRGEKVLAYRIYLGENATSDFNVRPNTSHTLDITIRGDNEIDTRVSGYTVDVWDTIDSDSHNGYCIAGPAHRLFVHVEEQNNDSQLSCRIVASAGDSRVFYVDGRQVGASGTELTLADGKNEFAIDYTPTRFDAANATLEYAVIVSDEYGFTRTFGFSHRFANQVLLYAPFKSVETKGAVFSQARSDHLYVLVDGDGCTITATALPDYIFRGWYSDAAYKVLVSTAANYHYKPQSRIRSFYAEYETTVTPLDTSGTANCYVVPDC